MSLVTILSCSGNYSTLGLKVECTSLGQLTSPAPGTETRNRNQEELETRENKGTRSAVSMKMWFVELFGARQEPGVRTDYQCICQSAWGRERIPAQKKWGEDRRKWGGRTKCWQITPLQAISATPKTVSNWWASRDMWRPFVLSDKLQTLGSGP